MIRINKGLDLPISGAPVQQIETGPPVSQVALLGRDYQDMRPTLLVAEGDQVALGEPLFFDKKNPRVSFTAPGAGEVVAINRGSRRTFLSLVIKLDGAAEKTFPATPAERLSQLTSEEVEARLIDAGLWPALRTRPYSKVPVPGTRPAALFVTAIDSRPLAADPQVIIKERSQEFRAGLEVLRHLCDGPLYLCQAPGAQLPAPAEVEVCEFAGVHPAGLVGTHIHFLERVDQQRSVWHLGYQDLIAAGHLFLHGRLLTERIVSLAGPSVQRPRLVRTRLGAGLSGLVAGQLHSGENRVVSGSVLDGDHATDAVAYLGRYHNQVSVIAEDRQREFIGWALPGRDRFSVKRLFAGALRPGRKLPLTTSTHGSLRAMVPTHAFEQVMPLNIKATWLLRTLLALDIDLAQGLGCLELDEEDLALCSFVCSGKMNYGRHLRQTLQKIEKEG